MFQDARIIPNNSKEKPSHDKSESKSVILTTPEQDGSFSTSVPIIVSETVLEEVKSFRDRLRILNHLGPDRDKMKKQKVEDDGKSGIESFMEWLGRKPPPDQVMSTFDEKLHEAQKQFHQRPEFLHHYVMEGDLHALKEKLRDKCKRKLDRIALARPDPLGATPIHLAFMHKKYEIGKYLVERYPDIGM